MKYVYFVAYVFSDADGESPCFASDSIEVQGAIRKASEIEDIGRRIQKKHGHRTITIQNFQLLRTED